MEWDYVPVGGAMIDYYILIGNDEYRSEDIFSATITQPLFEKLSVGNACSAELKIRFEPKGTIPRMASIIVRARDTDSGQTYEQIGVFYIDTRKMNGSVMEITAYDAMLKAEQVWVPSDLLTFPMSMLDAASEIARIMDVTIDSRTVLREDYTIDYPADNYTMRDILRNIAAAHCGNWVITGSGELRLIPLFGASNKKYAVNSAVSSLEVYDPIGPITGVSLGVDEQNAYQSGSKSGYVLEADCDWGTQDIADNLLTALSGKKYYGYRAQQAELDIVAELGDGIIIGDGVESFLAYRKINFGPGHMSEIAAPGENEVDHEYPYLSKDQRDLKKKIAQGTFYYGVAVSRQYGLMVKKTNGQEVAGEVLLNSDVFSMRAMIDGQMVDCIYFDTAQGRYRLAGNVIIDGGLTVDTLYAQQGDIAQLTVDWIDTSHKINRYLEGDTSDDNHFVGHDQTISFVSASVVMNEAGVAETEQLTNRYGRLLYWEKDISGADIINGFPYVDGTQVMTQTDETDYPVIVYKYTETVKRAITFEAGADGTYVPVDTFGAGNEQGYNKGKIVKTPDGLEIKYTSSTGKELSIIMANAGYVEIKGMRKTDSLDFSGWNSGSFSEKLEGATDTTTYGVSFDSSGRPIKITDGEGHEMNISW